MHNVKYFATMNIIMIILSHQKCIFNHIVTIITFSRVYTVKVSLTVSLEVCMFHPTHNHVCTSLTFWHLQQLHRLLWGTSCTGQHYHNYMGTDPSATRAKYNFSPYIYFSWEGCDEIEINFTTQLKENTCSTRFSLVKFYTL